MHHTWSAGKRFSAIPKPAGSRGFPLSGHLVLLVNSLRVYMAAVKQSTNLHQAQGERRAARLLNSDKALIPAIKYWFKTLLHAALARFLKFWRRVGGFTCGALLGNARWFTVMTFFIERGKKPTLIMLINIWDVESGRARNLSILAVDFQFWTERDRLLT